jgi:ribonuclease-3 family protein
MNNLNVLTLAYLGDAIYEVYIRKYLISKNIVKVNDLQKESIKYVSAINQSLYLEKLIKNNFLTEEELSLIKRARNHKSHNKKNTDIVTYKKATALETLIGFLYLNNNIIRINQIINFILEEKIYEESTSII